MKPKVSINLCCYNSEKYLRETLDSVVSQTHKDWELVIINDGSIDSTESIIREYVEQGYPIIYHYQQNKGLSYSRNKALELSGGEFIALIDHDDLWLDNTLKKLVDGIESDDYALCYGGVQFIDKHGKKIRDYTPKYSSGYIFDRLLKHIDIYIPAVIIRKSVLDNYTLRFDENLKTSEDVSFFLELGINRKFCVLRSPISQYRIHDESLTSASISRWAYEREYTLDLICSKYPEIRESYRGGFKQAYAKANYYRARYYMFKGRKNEAINEMKKVLFTNHKYFVLFILLFFPDGFWNFAHKLRYHRSVFSEKF